MDTETAVQLARLEEQHKAASTENEAALNNLAGVISQFTESLNSVQGDLTDLRVALGDVPLTKRLKDIWESINLLRAATGTANDPPPPWYKQPKLLSMIAALGVGIPGAGIGAGYVTAPPDPEPVEKQDLKPLIEQLIPELIEQLTAASADQ